MAKFGLVDVDYFRAVLSGDEALIRLQQDLAASSCLLSLLPSADAQGLMPPPFSYTIHISSPNHSSDRQRIQRNPKQLRAVIMTGSNTTKQRRAQPENPNGAKLSIANPSPTTRTVSWHDIPEWRRDNKYILTGYRPLEADYLQGIKSLTFLHNETCNVYTHLIGALLMPLFATVALQTICEPQYVGVIRTDFIMFSIFFCSAESCLIFSAVYHLIGSHSREVEQFWHRMDLLGIVIVTVGTFIPGIYYIFNCEPFLQRIHWTIVLLCGSATAALISIPKFRTLRWRKVRVGAYVALGASAFIPLFHGVKLYGLDYMLKYSGMRWYLVELVLYGGGCGLYAVRTS
ncbi:hypothetical protein FNYG_05335 [Fusarium nygamai]|uniref:Uncharacterized protein n=1 Tax=Gibberella nygamai TaxID=42673 RepID=A0A2K0WGA0_GIBNY|nr:hypothetical protein FNYG_05335 [Fusarium nygamai]